MDICATLNILIASWWNYIFYVDLFQYCLFQFSSVQMSNSLQPHGLLCARLPCLSPTPLTHMPFESVMPSNHLTLCRPLLILPSVIPSIRVFSNESVLHIRWPKYWNFSFNISPSWMNVQDWSPSGWTGWTSFQSKGLSRVFSNTTVQKHQFFNAQLSL